jgi:GntR family transcriptional regulator, transcriptional repressor for pyruvate dehydrogenase complex
MALLKRRLPRRQASPNHRPREPGQPAQLKRRPEPTHITRGKNKTKDGQGIGPEVLNRILELVRTGNLRPGDRLPPERELIEIFGIGRPGLRESLRSLATLGVIEIRHGGGAYITGLDAKRLLAPLDFVLSLTPKILDESTECRRLIECEAVRKAAENATAEDLAEFEEMLQAHAAVKTDPVGFRILDSRFHSKIYATARNSVLEKVATALYNIGLEQRRIVTTQKGQITKSTRDHKAIVAALKSGDPSAAMAAMEVHLGHIADSTRDLLEGRLAG